MVSICIPAFNGSAWIREAVTSALAQTYRPIEVLVVDDASTDETLDVLRGMADDGVRVIVNEKNLGFARNWERCVDLAGGEYIKFLSQDDLLAPECVARMVALMERSPAIGMVFSRRNILADDPNDSKVRRWVRHHSILDYRFGPLRDVNHGRTLFHRAARRLFRENWIGEPSCVLLRRSALERVGGINVRMANNVDWEMWLRVMYYFDVGFISEPLVTYRVHARSWTARSRVTRSYWLDTPWLIEGLRQHPEIRSAHPELARAGVRLLLEALHAELRRAWGGRKRRAARQIASDVAAYVRFRLSARGSVGTVHTRGPS